MSFFGKVFQHLFQDAAINKLASSKSFQSFAVKVVDGQKALKTAAEQAVNDPTKAKEAISSQAGTFWQHLKAEIQKDLTAAAKDTTTKTK